MEGLGQDPWPELGRSARAADGLRQRGASLRLAREGAGVVGHAVLLGVDGFDVIAQSFSTYSSCARYVTYRAVSGSVISTAFRKDASAFRVCPRRR